MVNSFCVTVANQVTEKKPEQFSILNRILTTRRRNSCLNTTRSLGKGRRTTSPLMLSTISPETIPWSLRTFSKRIQQNLSQRSVRQANRGPCRVSWVLLSCLFQKSHVTVMTLTCIKKDELPSSAHSVWTFVSLLPLLQECGYLEAGLQVIVQVGELGPWHVPHAWCMRAYLGQGLEYVFLFNGLKKQQELPISSHWFL